GLALLTRRHRFLRRKAAFPRQVSSPKREELFSHDMVARFPFRYGRLARWLLTPFLMGPRRSWVEVTAARVQVRMGLAFRASIPRSTIVSARAGSRVTGVGVHGRRGRWRVSSSRYGIVSLELDPPVRARFNGIPIRVRELRLS